MLALPFSPTSPGRHYPGFPVAIKTFRICVNFALINEIMLFERKDGSTQLMPTHPKELSFLLVSVSLAEISRFSSVEDVP